MRITYAYAENFQSYETIEFSYKDLGLALISGPTGAGKSTLLDLVPWTLYNTTSKDGASDDVKPWSGGVTASRVDVALPDGAILEVNRIRGTAAQNDLYWLEGDTEEQHRGKDLTETQKLLEARLGVTSELFILGSYLTQFSKADSFFIAKAKDRREVLEKIADQEFAIQLGEKSSTARKEAKKLVITAQNDLSGVTGKLEGLKDSIEGLKSSLVSWESQHVAKLLGLQSKLNSFEQDQHKVIAAIKTKSLEWQAARDRKMAELTQDLKALPLAEDDTVYAGALALVQRELAALKDTRCPSCSALTESEQREDYKEEISALIQARNENWNTLRNISELKKQIKAHSDAPDPHLSGLQQVQSQANPYADQIVAAQLEANPFQPRIDQTWLAIEVATTRRTELQASLAAAESQVSRLNWLYDKSFELRGILMTRAVSQIQDATNAYLERFFDAALRISLTVEGSDKIEVEIYNEGHLAPFKSLSGGERCMLKLAFSLSLMKAAQHKAGVSFNMLMLDEPFSGLDTGLKEKAFGLLQELSTEYPTVLVIEHDEEIKNLFEVKFLVDKCGGQSTIVLSESENNA